MSTSASPEPRRAGPTAAEATLRLAALRAFAAPLQFAAQQNFAHAQRVVDLEKTLRRALKNCLQAGPEASVAAAVAVLQAALGPDGAPLTLPQLRRLHALYLQLVGQAPPAGPPPPPPGREGALPATAARPASGSAAAASPAKAPRPPPTQVAQPEARAAAAELRPPEEVPLSSLRGVGPRLQAALARRNLHSVADLLRFLPRRYQGQEACDHLGDLADGVAATVEAEVDRVAQRFVRGRRSLEVVCRDPSAALHLVWFRVPGGKAFVEQFVRGAQLRVTGTVKRYRGRLQMAHPTVQVLETLAVAATPSAASPDPDAAAPHVVPLYLDVEGFHPLSLRRLIAQVLPQAAGLVDPLPPPLRARRQLCSLAAALQELHRPPPTTSLDALQTFATAGQRRLIYDELLLLQLRVLQSRQQASAVAAAAVPLRQPLLQTAAAMVPFTLTGAQQRVLEDIDADLRRARPMQRLLQGDVGCGKTAVALAAAAAGGHAGRQTSLLAPTELLAEQHARSAAAYFLPLGLRAELLTGHTPAAARRVLLAALAAGEVHLLIGTHAVIQPSVQMKALALGIVDEQHRFGVMQRARLQEMGRASLGAAPHMLVMTATPIPRTLALTVYGDLESSVIDELPRGRQPILTRLVRDTDRGRLYTRLVDELRDGRQAYVVFPLVEGSDKEGMADLRDASSAAEELAAGPLKSLRLGLLHGRMGADAKDAVMRAFAAHELDVLVATTVIEVGIDVPNATVMVVEHAERFGLSQLHQLRGRVGRGSAQSSCYLLMQRPGEDAWRRLSIMERSTDGFVIAEADLEIRGPGDFIGTRQAGLPELSLANLARDQAILQQARQDAGELLQADPQLQRPEYRSLAARLAVCSAPLVDLVQVG